MWAIEQTTPYSLPRCSPIGATEGSDFVHELVFYAAFIWMTVLLVVGVGR